MYVRMSGFEMLDMMLANGGKPQIMREIIELTSDCISGSKGSKELSDIDSDWDNLSRFDKINKGKRFKAYVDLGFIPGVSFLQKKSNKTLEYIIH